MEMLIELNDFGSEKSRDKLNKKYDNGNKLDQMQIAFFIPLPKTAGANE